MGGKGGKKRKKDKNSPNSQSDQENKRIMASYNGMPTSPMQGMQTQSGMNSYIMPRPSSPVRQVRRAPDHFFGQICYPPYHFFAVSFASVVLPCDLIPSKVSRFID